MNQVHFTTEIKRDKETMEKKSARPVFVFHWLGWRRFLRDLLIMQAGFFLTALSVAIFVNGGLGRLIPWGLYEYLLLDAFSIPVYIAFFLVTIAAFLLGLVLREPFGWGTPVSFIFVGLLLVSLLEEVVPILPGGIGLQILYVVVAVFAAAFGSAIFLSVNAGPAPRDILWLAVARRLRVNAGVAYAMVDAGLILIALLLGLSIGSVTIVHAVAVGPAVWLAFRLFHIKPRAEFWSRTATS